MKNNGAGGLVLFIGGGGEGASPGEVAMAGGVEQVAAFGEFPGFAREQFAEGKIVLRDVRLILGEYFFGDAQLVHQRETQVVFLEDEVDGLKLTGELVGGFPAD